jgi:Golgi phosphoprotein 3 (GPP34)
METLSDDLVLLSIRPDGAIGTAAKLHYGLSGAELVRLAALRRVDIERNRIVILDATPTGDVLLDEALKSMAGGRRPPAAKAWVAQKRGDLVGRYLERLAQAGTIRAGNHKVRSFIPRTGWTVLDAGRLAAARARLDAIAYGSEGVDAEQAALAGLAGAIDLQFLIYPGIFAGRAARKRIAAAGKSGGRATRATKRAAYDLDIPVDAATHAALSTATHAATQAAVHASVHAATHAAVSATHAASGGHAGGGHAGGGGGGHH